MRQVSHKNDLFIKPNLRYVGESTNREATPEWFINLLCTYVPKTMIHKEGWEVTYGIKFGNEHPYHNGPLPPTGEWDCIPLCYGAARANRCIGGGGNPVSVRYVCPTP